MEELKERYSEIIKEYITKFCKKQGFDIDDIEDLSNLECIFVADYYFDIRDIRYDLDNKIKKGLIIEWSDYVVANRQKNNYNINYSSYIRGARYGKYLETRRKKI